MKSEFRRFFLNLRREMEVSYIKENSEKIISNLVTSDLYKDAKSIFVYVSKDEEVATRDFIEKSIACGKKVYVPKIIHKKMYATRLNDMAELEDGTYGIPTSKKADYISNPDLTVCPGLSFDNDKNRLGYGGGFYDRFLAENKTTKVGLIISDFKSIKIENDDWDIKMDYVITEDEIY